MVNLGNESEENSLVPTVPKMGLLPLGSSKRALAVNNGIPAISCTVDGCDADLINCKEYHRRDKASEMHSRSVEVTIGGHKQCFCQQCGRNLMKAKEAVGNITTVGEESLSQNPCRVQGAFYPVTKV